jgi:hypothetical protein
MRDVRLGREAVSRALNIVLAILALAKVLPIVTEHTACPLYGQGIN